MITVDFIIKCLLSVIDGLNRGIETLWQSMCQVVTGIVQSGNPLCILMLILVVISIFIPIRRSRR